ncbi:MAG: beta-ketoacyl-ACP synthase II [Butyrivibrio sp.]
MRRVVVTGLGAVTPVGNTVDEMWKSIKAGKCGVAPITLYDTADRKVKLAAEVKNFKPEELLDKREYRKMDRFTQFAMVAAEEAMNDSGLDVEKEDRSRCGTIVSSGIGGIQTLQSEDEKGVENGFDRVTPFFVPMIITNIAAGRIAIKYGFNGICTCVVTACASATNAIGEAFHKIRDGYSDVMICGGSEACITSLGIGGFTSMKALCLSEDPERASIPFDKERHGFVMGEGAGMLVIEEYEHAVKRGAHIYCEITGYGSNCDAHHITAPLEDGSMAAECMKQAMADAGLDMSQMDYINAHGTSTLLNDRGETLAVKNAFGDHAGELMMSSTKSMTGHLLGASGAVEGVITALSVANDFVPATINYRVSDEECDLDIVPNEGRNVTVNTAMSNSFGFGGHNASIVFKKCK